MTAPAFARTGDGANDSGALKAADIGISIQASPSEPAIVDKAKLSPSGLLLVQLIVACVSDTFQCQNKLDQSYLDWIYRQLGLRKTSQDKVNRDHTLAELLNTCLIPVAPPSSR